MRSARGNCGRQAPGSQYNMLYNPIARTFQKGFRFIPLFCILYELINHQSPLTNDK